MTESDLRLFEAASHTHAIIVVDDVFNPNWPDVVVGFCRYCADSSTTFRPFALSHNKVYIARPARHGQYRDFLRQRWPQYFQTDRVMFDHAVGIYGLEASRAPMKAAFKSKVRRLPFYPLLKAGKERIRP